MEKEYRKIQEAYGRHILQTDTDDIVEQEVKFFIRARPMDWAFSVVPVYVDRPFIKEQRYERKQADAESIPII